jgi:hypothetical protein
VRFPVQGFAELEKLRQGMKAFPQLCLKREAPGRLRRRPDCAVMTGGLTVMRAAVLGARPGHRLPVSGSPAGADRGCRSCTLLAGTLKAGRGPGIVAGLAGGDPVRATEGQS